MGYDKEVLARARARYAQDVEEHRAGQRRRRAEIYAALPQAAELEGQLRQTMAQVIASSLRRGEDPTGPMTAIRDHNRALQQELKALLAAHGYSPDALEDSPRCPLCRDRGYVGEQMCQCLREYCRQEQTKELTSLLSGNVSFDDFSLDYYPTAVNPATGLSPRTQMELIYETCVNYARHFSDHSRNLLLSGAPGLGKTFLSACIAREVVNRGFSVVYDTAIHLFGCLERQKFGGGTPEELQMAQRIPACDLLILDDLGTEMQTAFITPALYTILNGRMLEGRPTIISTNLNMPQLSARYGPQIASRLEGGYEILSFAGTDIRRLKRAAR